MIMINSQRETADQYFPLKQEGNSNSIDHEKAKEASASSISSSLASQWTRLKDPRIVRVSRAFGGKDRHSKVCTIRGLRDRRVRLSVPTAIQLYDLQDKLGLNQPSKVVDWLLNAAKDEIDELPPLPNFPTPAGEFPFSTFPLFNEANNQQVLNTNSSIQLEEGSSSSQQNSVWKVMPREVEVSGKMLTDKGNYFWMNNSDNKQGINNAEPSLPSAAHVLPHNINLLPKANHNPSFLGLLNTTPIGNYQWVTNSSVVNSSSQLGNHGFTIQSSDHINVIRPLPLPSTLSLSTEKNSQIQQLGEGGTTTTATQSYFLSHDHVIGMEMDQRQINQQYQMLSNSSCSQNPLTNSSLNNPSFSLAMMTAPKFHYSSSNSSKSQNQQEFTHK